MSSEIVKKFIPEALKEIYREHKKRRYYENFRRIPGNTYRRFDETRSIFIHIPKAGGISIIKSLYGDEAGGIGHRPYTHFLWLYGEKNYRRYFKFTFVRNPFDRLLSAYSFLKKGGMNHLDRAFCEEALSAYDSFEKFVMQWLSEESAMSWIHFIPQHNFLFDDEGNQMVDFIGKFENFNEDYEKIRQRIGTGEKLKHLNKTPDKKEKSYREAYTPQMIEKVAEVYKKDLELFKYNF